MQRPSHSRIETNKPQAEGNANSLLYSRERNSNKPFTCAAILDYRRQLKTVTLAIIKSNTNLMFNLSHYC